MYLNINFDFNNVNNVLRPLTHKIQIYSAICLIE